MTATDELRRLLDEREVEWEAFDDFEQTTQWSTHNGAFVYWARERDGKLLVETTAPTKCSVSCTPEQAIAATLGNVDLLAENAKLRDERDRMYEANVKKNGEILRLLEENAKLKAENAKLRELVADAHACKENDGCCEDCYADEGDCPIEQRMRELGIEVG